MLAILLSAALTAAPAVATAPVASAPDPEATADSLQALYQGTCGDKAYGAYDDLCGNLANQARKARVEADRYRREKARAAKAATKAPS